MEWDVTYRSKGGKRTSDVFTAGSREELFKVLASRGLSAIRIEAVSDKNRRSAMVAKNGKHIKVLVSVFVTLAAVIAALVVITRPNETRNDDSIGLRGGKRPVKQPEHRQAVNTGIAKSSKQNSGQHDPSDSDKTPPSERIVATVSVVTNADGSVIERFQTADGKIRSKQSPPRPIFDSPSDQIIALAVSGATAGGEMPPIPSLENADEAFKESVEKDIVINESDPDDVKALKQSVIAVRDEIKQLLSEGRSFEEILKEHRELVNKSAEMRDEATRLVKEFLDEGDRDTAVECLGKVNEVLNSMGFDEIELPPSREERRALIREQHGNK